jgi:hypothetical protein
VSRADRDVSTAPVLPLYREQVLAAGRLCTRLSELQRCERALHALQGCFPGFDAESCLLKVLSLRAIDSITTFTAPVLASHVHGVMGTGDPATAGWELVDALAAFPGDRSIAPARRLAFGSRFAHYFVDRERFPILDTWSEQGLAAHLVLEPESDSATRYERFARDFARLADALGGTNRRELGRYLWLAGQHRAWLRSAQTPIQHSVRALFEAAPRSVELLFCTPPDPSRDLETVAPCLPNRSAATPASKLGRPTSEPSFTGPA